MNTGTISRAMRPISMPATNHIPSAMNTANVINHDLHIKQTIDRLKCIQKHLKNPSLFGRTIQELIEWCSDPRAFRPHYHSCLLDCLTVVNDIAGEAGFDIGHCYRLLQMCYEQRDKFMQSASSMIAVWFRRIQNLMIVKQPPSHLDQNHIHGQQIPQAHPQYNNSLINSKMQYSHNMSQRVPDQAIWNQQQQQHQPPSHPNQHSALSVITTATVWGVSTTQTPPIPVHSQSSSTSFANQQMNYPGSQIGGNNAMSYSTNYPNKQNMNEPYQHQQGIVGMGQGRMGGQRHHLNTDQSHPAAAAAAAAVAAAAAAATATATATATFIKGQQDQTQNNSYDQQIPPSMPSNINGPLHSQGLSNHQPLTQSGLQGLQPPNGRMRSQMPPQYGRAASVPTSYPISSPRPLTHTPTQTYTSDGFKASCRPQLTQYVPTPFNTSNTPNPLKTPDIFPNHYNSGSNYNSRHPNPGSNNISQNHYYSSNQQLSDTFLPHPLRQHLPSHHNMNENRFCSTQTPIPGNPTPPLTPGSTHPPFSGTGLSGMNEPGGPIESFSPYLSNAPPPQHSTDADDLRLTFPVRDGVVLPPFRLEHNLSVSNHAFHLRENVHNTLFERPDLDLQFKCCHHDDVMRHTNWPHSVQVRVNSTQLAVPRGMERSLHKPLYLKGVCKPGRNNIEIAVSACCCSHYFVLQLVHRPTIRSVLKGLLVKRILPDISCRSKIKRNFSSGTVTNNDVIINSPNDPAGTLVRVSLLCPITGNRIRIPARGQECKHIQCFDLESYLQGNCDNATWTCPICRKLALLEYLEVDEFMQGVIKSAPDCLQVSIDSNCTWGPLSGATTPHYHQNSLSRAMSAPMERRTPMIKQELMSAGINPGAGQFRFGPNQEKYISALSIKKEPFRVDASIKPDPDAPPHKRLKSSSKPGVNHPSVTSGSRGGCGKVEHGTGFPQSQKFTVGPQQLQKGQGPGGAMPPGSLMVADMKEYVATNDMVSIERRLNPAVNHANINSTSESSPQSKPCLVPTTPIRPPSSSVALTPQSVGSTNCSNTSLPNLPPSKNEFSTDISEVGPGSANPNTPVVKLPDCNELSIDCLDSVFPFFDDGIAEKDSGTISSSLNLDHLPGLGKEEGILKKPMEPEPSSDIMDILSDLNDPSSNIANPEEEKILSLFDSAS